MSLAETNGAMKNYILSIPQPPNPPQHNLEFFISKTVQTMLST